MLRRQWHQPSPPTRPPVRKPPSSELCVHPGVCVCVGVDVWCLLLRRQWHQPPPPTRPPVRKPPSSGLCAGDPPPAKAPLRCLQAPGQSRPPREQPPLQAAPPPRPLCGRLPKPLEGLSVCVLPALVPVSVAVARACFVFCQQHQHAKSCKLLGPARSKSELKACGRGRRWEVHPNPVLWVAQKVVRV